MSFWALCMSFWDLCMSFWSYTGKLIRVMKSHFDITESNIKILIKRNLWQFPFRPFHFSKLTTNWRDRNVIVQRKIEVCKICIYTWVQVIPDLGNEGIQT